MNLVIDIGNSFTKTAFFKDKELLRTDVFEKFTENEIENIFNEYPNPSTIVSSVATINEALNKYLKSLSHCHYLNSKTRLPIINDYLTPNTLGNDRLANAVGAQATFPKQNVLVIDLGTCMKFDFVNAKGAYMGGAISPGLKMRYNALHEFTEQLPYIEPIHSADLIGNNTINSIHSGVYNGMLAEINGIIQQYEMRTSDLKVILTGGDVRYFSIHLKNNIFAAPYLTLLGLNEILLYHQ